MFRPGLEEQHHLVLVLQLPLPLVDAAHRRKDVAASDQSFLDEDASKVGCFVRRGQRGEDEERVGHGRRCTRTRRRLSKRRFPRRGLDTRRYTPVLFAPLYRPKKRKRKTPMIDVKRLGVLALVCAVSTSSAFAKGISGRDGEPEPEQDRGDAPHTITFFCTDLSDLLDVKVAVIVGTNQLVVPTPSPI